MPIDFTNIQTTRGRQYDTGMISRLNDSLQALPIKQRAAILGSVIEESGGDPLAKSENGTYQGLLQWGKDRYRIASNDREKEFAKQIQLIRNTLNDSTDQISWTHGGEGSGYSSFKEPLHIFHNSERPLKDIYRAFSYGYVRPKGKEDSYNNRLKVAQQVYDRLKTQPSPTITKQDVVDAAMLGPKAVAAGVGTVANYINRAVQKYVKPKDNSKNNTVRWAEGGFLNPKDAWDALSMKDKADMIGIAVKHGITTLSDIRDKYNEFAEGGGMEESMNTIPEDYTPLASPAWQPVIDKMKQDSYKSNVEDFAYRVQKMHPEITQQQVEEAYKSVPIIASDSRRGRETGKYVYGDESGYGQRIMLYPNRMKEDQGVGGLTREDQLRNAMGHEANHLYVHTLLGGNYTDEEKALLDAAYPDDLFHVPEGGNIYDEKRAYNMQVRKALSEAYGNLVGADYDKATEKMKPDDVMWNYSQLGTGYMSDYQKVKQKYKKGSKWDQKQVDAILKATKDVAYTPTVNPYEYGEGVNYAALGGPIVEAAMNEFAKGGDTNPYTVGATVDALYASNPREEYLGEPSHHYDFTQSEEWANEHGYYPDARGHRDDRVKKPAHPSHPSRGTWDGDKFELTDLGMQNPNYTLFGLTDGGQDPQAVLTYQGGIVLPEVTVTPNENYFYNPYDNIILHQKANGGKIHIKPENRGKFTALKERTGHSATWFKEHGTPAQKKMATFALNARKWKHGLGGNLFDGTSQPTQKMEIGKPYYSYDENGRKIDDTLNYNISFPEVVIIPDSKKSPAERNENERYRQRTQRDYAEQKSRDYTERQIAKSQKEWDNSLEKTLFNYGQTAAMGIGIGADIVSALPIYSSLKGASTLSRAETPLGYIEGGLWLTPMLGGTYQGIKPIFKTASKPVNPNNLFEAIQYNAETSEATGRLSETQQAAEKGRNKLLEWIQSPFYKQRLEEEPFYRFSNDIANEASTIVKDAPLDFSKTVREIDPSGNIAGTTKTRPALKVRDDDYRVFDLNTGLDVNIGSDLGNEAEDTTLHELLHYLTVNSKGIPESTSTMQIVDKGWMQPLEALYNPVGKNILRGKKWQNYILDQNDALLPKYDSVVDMVMNRPDEAKAALLKAGRTEAQADVAIKSLQDRYAYWADIQEQRAHLQELFISKIKPHLKNPNDAAEIESFLSQHPEILENSAPYNYIQEIRPGSLKQYAGYFASALSTLPFINKLTTNEQ